MRGVSRAVAVTALALTVSITGVSASGAPDPVASHPHEHVHAGSLPVPEPRRGLVYDGLTPASHDPRCSGADGLFQVRTGGGRVVGCTHGPDPAPAGIVVGSRPTTSELVSETVAAEPSCVGDGVSGYRVHAIYAVPEGTPSRYSTIAPLIRSWAATNVDAIIGASAAQTGGARQVRFVTDAACQLVVDEVRLSSSGDDTFGNTIAELEDRGYVDPTRKYLVWMDAPGPYCGIAETYLDDRDVLDNYNNGRSGVPGMVARVDAPCWGSSQTPVEAHELVHTLGAVQSSAPHSTGAFPAPAGGHCTDEADVMCYDDDGTGPAATTVVCPSTEERRLDCGDDDYFHTDPPPGSYLDTHWNTASSRFLDTATAVISEPDAPSADTEERSLSLTSSRRRVPRGRRVKVTALLRACQGPGEVVKLKGRDIAERSRTNADCVATFRVRIDRKTRLRARSDPDRVGAGSVTSNRIVVRVRR